MNPAENLSGIHQTASKADFLHFFISRFSLSLFKNELCFRCVKLMQVGALVSRASS